MESFKLILTSTLLAGIVSAFVSYIISIKLKNLDFKNEYYKEILKKRLVAYQYIESQLAVLKIVVLDETDSKPYHMMFSYSGDDFLDFQKNMAMAISYSLWIDEESTNNLEMLNELFYNLNLKISGKTSDELKDLGKKHYQHISDLRFQLENSTKRGLYNLHDIEKAFKTKKANTKRNIRELN